MAGLRIEIRGEELRIGEQSRRLSPSVGARVESSGSRVEIAGRRPSLLSMATLGPWALLRLRRRRVDDGRRLYLVVEGPDWFEQLDCTGIAEVEVRLMAQRINAAARSQSEG